jgi:membrane protease YdiL (CAAX protease family)
MSKYTIFYLEVLFFFVIPVSLLTVSSNLLAARHVLMGVGGLYCAWRLIKSSATLADLGFHATGFWQSLKNIVIPSALIILATYLVFLLTPHNFLKFLVGYDSLPTVDFAKRILAYVILSAPVQELIFRGYMIWRIKEIYKNPKEIEFISIALFTLAHLPFHSPLILVITFFMGLVYVKNYEKYQNIYTVTISHAVVGAALIIIRNAWFPF